MVICGSFLKWIPGNNICRGSSAMPGNNGLTVSPLSGQMKYSTSLVICLPALSCSIIYFRFRIGFSESEKNMNLQKYYFSFALYLID